jgi:methionyl-tRNA synthetase
MPDTAKAINTQLRVKPLPILDRWAADFIKPGHEIGEAHHLFTRIDPAKADEWREAFGSKEIVKVKEEGVVLKARRNEARNGTTG